MSEKKTNQTTVSMKLKQYALVLAAGWTVLIIGLGLWNAQQKMHNARELVRNDARANFLKDQAFRLWASGHGGVYVPSTEHTPPSPHLAHIHDRDIETPTGKKLTLMNPAYMVRQLMESFENMYGVKGRITSLKPLYPGNAPDEWEQAALRSFEKGVTEVNEFTETDGEPSLRLMRPMMVKPSCLKCHGHQGYADGDVRGGVGVSVPAGQFFARARKELAGQSFALGLLWLIGLAGMAFGTGLIRRRVSEREEAEKELAKHRDRLEEMNQELQRLDTLKDEFLANTSHELRTPLNGIIGIAESLIDGAAGPMTDAQRHNLSLIVSSGRRLTNLVSDILDFSKLRHHELHLRTKPLDMKSVTDVVLMLSQTIIGNKELLLVNRIEAALPAVEADENRVQQILHNLVGNAVKFTDAGTVSVSAEVMGEYLAVTISDTGIGIPGESLDRIFRLFEQGDGSTAREYGGTGLGLAVTRNLVELHGGQIRAESEPGKGSRFTFTLPVSGDKAELTSAADILAGETRVAGIPAEPAEIGETEEPDISEIPQEHLCGGRLCKILAVDDEPVNLQVLRNHLAPEYYSVIPVSDGREAIAALESGQKFDLVLLDIMMPEMSGYEVCRRLREKHPKTDLPVLMLTAKNQVDDLVAGFDSGASDYLTKPFSKKELLARVNTHIMLKSLHESRMRAETEASLLAQEMEIAEHIQTSLVPEKPKLPGYEIAASMWPAEQVGGDYYDFISVDDHDWIVFGDVSGHGISAGLVMMMVQTAIHTMLAGNPEISPSGLLSGINRIIYENIEKMGESKHMTISVMAGGRNGDFTFAGLHEDIFIRRAGTGKVDEIETKGMWIGLEPDISPLLSDDTLKLDPGDCMILFTDGITEAEDSNGGLFGSERLAGIIGESGNGSASAIHDSIIHALEPYEKPDDVTLVIVRRLE